jgi:Ca2+-binding EF-hand superfamily protein
MLAQRQEEEKQRHIRNFLFLRLVKDVLKHERSVEYVKQVLFSHKGFSVHEAFRFLDVQQRGEVSAADLEEVFAKHNLVLNNASLVVDACDVDDDATIDYKELENAISPAGAHNLRGR